MSTAISLPVFDQGFRYVTVTDLNTIKRQTLKESLARGTVFILGCDRLDLGKNDFGKEYIGVLLGVDAYEEVIRRLELHPLPSPGIERAKRRPGRKLGATVIRKEEAQERLKIMKDMREQGHSLAEIGAKFHIGQQRVKQLLYAPVTEEEKSGTRTISRKRKKKPQTLAEIFAAEEEASPSESAPAIDWTKEDLPWQ